MRITSAFDKELEQIATIEEVSRNYLPYIERYLCPNCFDRLALANGEHRTYLRHWRSKDGHDCDLYSAQKYSSTKPQNTVCRRIRQSENYDCTLYCVKEGFGYSFQLALPLFSRDEILAFQEKHTYIVVQKTRYDINTANFECNERLFVPLSVLETAITIQVSSDEGVPIVQTVNAIPSKGCVFRYLGAETTFNDPSFFSKKLADGATIYIGNHYLYISKTPFPFLPWTEQHSLSLSHTPRVFDYYLIDFVINRTSPQSILFCNEHNYHLAAHETEPMLLWPPMACVRDYYYQTQFSTIFIHSLNTVESSSTVEATADNVYSVAVNGAQRIKIGSADSTVYTILPFSKEYQLYDSALEKTTVDTITSLSLRRDATSCLFSNHVLKEIVSEAKIRKHISIKTLIGLRVIATYSFKEKKEHCNQLLIDAIMYDQQRIECPAFIKVMDFSEDDDTIKQYVQDAKEANQISKTFVDVIIGEVFK